MQLITISVCQYCCGLSAWPKSGVPPTTRETGSDALTPEGESGARTIGDHELTCVELARRFGTPVYVTSESQLRDDFRMMKESLDFSYTFKSSSRAVSIHFVSVSQLTYQLEVRCELG